MLSTFYYVSIDTNHEDIKVVYPNTAPNMPHATPKQIIAEYNLNIYTTWAKWSSCSKCNLVGKKVRYGHCTISLHENDIKSYAATKEKQLEVYRRQSIFFLCYSLSLIRY
nr:PREDICTED: uncharacterized protein LOC105662122 [Megachile rotundata]